MLSSDFLKTKIANNYNLAFVCIKTYFSNKYVILQIIVYVFNLTIQNKGKDQNFSMKILASK